MSDQMSDADKDYRDMRRFQAKFIEADQKLRAAEARVAELETDRDNTMDLYKSAWTKYVHGTNHIADLEDALRVVLPMAKGYAAKHNVGRNQEMVVDAERCLSGSPAPVREAERAVVEAAMKCKDEFHSSGLPYALEIELRAACDALAKAREAEQAKREAEDASDT